MTVIQFLAYSCVLLLMDSYLPSWFQSHTKCNHDQTRMSWRCRVFISGSNGCKLSACVQLLYLAESTWVHPYYPETVNVLVVHVPFQFDAVAVCACAHMPLAALFCWRRDRLISESFLKFSQTKHCRRESPSKEFAGADALERCASWVPWAKQGCWL